MITSTALADLPGSLKYRLNKAKASMDYAERALKFKNMKDAKTYYESAQGQIDTILKSWKGKFDEKDPEWVATLKRLSDFEAKLGTKKAPAPKKEEKPKPVKKALPRAVSYRLSKAKYSLDFAKKALQRKDMRAAKQSYESGRDQLDTILKNNKGRFDEAHPDWVAMINLANEIAMGLGNMSGKSAALEKVLPDMLAAIQELRQNFDSARNKVSLGLDSKPELDLLRPHFNSAFSLIPEINSLTGQFRKQFPNPDELKKLTKRGAEALQLIAILEQSEKTWWRIVDNASTRYIRELEQTLNTQEKLLADAQKASVAAKKTFATQAEEQADWIESRLALLHLIYPAKFKLSKAQTKRRKSLTAYAERSFGLRKTAAKLRGQAIADAALRLKNARFPKLNPTKATPKLVNKMKSSYLKRFPKESIVRFGVASDWEQRRVVTWEVGKGWVVHNYHDIWAYVCAKTSKLRVFRIMYRKEKFRDGSFGPLLVWSSSAPYEILPENLKK